MSTITDTAGSRRAFAGGRRGMQSITRTERIRRVEAETEQRRRAEAKSRAAERKLRRELATAEIERVKLDTGGYTGPLLRIYTRRMATAWVAALQFDADGALERRFCSSQTREGWIHAAVGDDWHVGDAIEIGTIDRNSNGARRGRDSRCGVVVAKRKRSVDVIWVRGPKTAIQKAEQWQPFLSGIKKLRSGETS